MGRFGNNTPTNATTFLLEALALRLKIIGTPIWWDGPDGSCAYVWGEHDFLRQFKFDWNAGKFILPNVAQSPTQAPDGMPGGMLCLSANGTNAGSGILWASHQYSGDANQEVRPGILHAYNAEDVSMELWNTEQFSARDSVGNFAKFVPPTVANGKVYLATFSNRLNVYGLLPRLSLGVAYSGGNVTISWPTNYAAGYRLQFTTTLSPANWMDDTNAAVPVGNTFTVTTPVAETAVFYRLTK